MMTLATINIDVKQGVKKARQELQVVYTLKRLQRSLQSKPTKNRYGWGIGFRCWICTRKVSGQTETGFEILYDMEETVLPYKCHARSCIMLRTLVSFQQLQAPTSWGFHKVESFEQSFGPAIERLSC